MVQAFGGGQEAAERPQRRLGPGQAGRRQAGASQVGGEAAQQGTIERPEIDHRVGVLAACPRQEAGQFAVVGPQGVVAGVTQVDQMPMEGMDGFGQGFGHGRQCLANPPVGKPGFR